MSTGEVMSVFFIVLVAPILLVLFVGGWLIFSAIWTRRSWQKTDGRIQATVVERAWPEEDWRVSVTYGFQVDGRRYTGRPGGRQGE
jgi:hypothetical protein